MKKASIGFRLGAFAAFLLLALIGISTQGWYTLGTSSVRHNDAMHRASLLGNAVDTARSAQVNFKIQVQDWKDILLRGHDSDAYKQYLDGFNKENIATLDNLQSLSGEFSELGLNTQIVLDAQRMHIDLNGKYLEALKRFDPKSAGSIRDVDRLVRGIDRIPTEKMDDIVTYVLLQRDRMQQELMATEKEAYRASVLWSLLVTVIGLSFGIGATGWMVRGIRRQLLATLKLTQAVADGTTERLTVVSAISKGNLDQEITLTPLPQINMKTVSSDEVGDMVRTVIAMGGLQTEFDSAFMQMSTALRKNRDEEHAREWFQSGQNQLNMLMQGEQGTRSLSDKVLFYLVERMSAHVGVFYLFDEQLKQLQLISQYATAQDKKPADSLAIGDGLIGQAVRERKTIYATDIPPSYLPIGSAWGTVPSCSVIAIPLLNGGRLIGAMELGASKSMTENELTFLEKMRESIAIGFDVNLSRQRTIALLEETNQQAEELRVQQEELQQSNQELEERAEMLEQQREQIRTKNSELETASAEIQRRSTELESVSAYKTEFMSNMSHELRTPLNSMLILSGMLKENKGQNLSEKQVEYATTINNAGKDLLILINDILDLAKVESGQIEFQYDQVPTEDVCAAMTKLFNPAAENKHLTFKTEVEEGFHQEIHIDQQRTQQVLKNLISNALKFTDEGSITLKVHAPQPMHNPLPVPSIAFAVSDTGIGVAHDKHGIIFDAFKQADGGISRNYGGTGLGLSISRQLARKMGGDLQMTSVVGQGSIFTLYLPLVPEIAADLPIVLPASKSVPHNQSNVAMTPTDVVDVHSILPVIADDREQLTSNQPSILIVEDDVNFAKILIDFVRARGFAAVVATDGESGISLASHYVPNAILLDVMLPKVDGWEVMSTLKGNLRTRHIPVHFITCIEDRKKAMDMGAIGFVTKPVTHEQMDQVFQTIECALAKSVKNLLIVEDNSGQAKGLIELLTTRDVVITIAKSGEEAIELLSSERFDCMVLDLGLGEMSGFELLEHIQKMDQAKQIPVIIHSGKDLTRDQERELHRYAESIIVKGAKSPERLLNEVTLFLHMVESTLESSKQKMIRASIKMDQTLEGKKVLVVDDDMRNVFSLASLLTDAGLSVVEAENGVEALAKLAEDHDFDVVLMDIMMPEMDGYEAIRRIRSDPRYKTLPVIAMTAKAMQGDQQKCIDAGANEYISKPIDSQMLMSLLRVWTSRR